MRKATKFVALDIHKDSTTVELTSEDRQRPRSARVSGDADAQSPHSPMGQGRTRGWAQSVLMTIGQACRAVSRETLSKTIHWAVEQATTLEWNQQRIVTCLELA